MPSLVLPSYQFSLRLVCFISQVLSGQTSRTWKKYGRKSFRYFLFFFSSSFFAVALLFIHHHLCVFDRFDFMIRTHSHARHAKQKTPKKIHNKYRVTAAAFAFDMRAHKLMSIKLGRPHKRTENFQRRSKRENKTHPFVVRGPCVCRVQKNKKRKSINEHLTRISFFFLSILFRRGISLCLHRSSDVQIPAGLVLLSLLLPPPSYIVLSSSSHLSFNRMYAFVRKTLPNAL